MKRSLFGFILAIAIFAAAGPVVGEEIKIATYNIEHFSTHFEAHRERKSTTEKMTKGENDENRDLQARNDKDNWITSMVISDPNFSPDILAIEECCNQGDLTYFNDRWLDKSYAQAIVFQTNTTRDQNLGLLLKPGFKIIDRKDQYYLEDDTAKNERSEKLFARGPVFLLIESPSGYRFWFGFNHMKSKADNNLQVTEWRNREAARIHQIIEELSKNGTTDLVFVGDLNDELGMDKLEEKAGADCIGTLMGKPEENLILVTEPLTKEGKISFGGYWKSNHRSFIDHVIVTKTMADQVENIAVLQNDLTKIASDHFPVMMKIKSDPATTTQPTTPAHP